jgi:hypothetical protein
MNSTTPNSPTNKLNNWKASWQGRRISLVDLQAEKARRKLHEFVRQAWPVLEPSTPFVDGIHVQAICSHLQAVTEGRLGDLIINVPPGHAKSLLTAVFWPAWVWISWPHIRWLFASYAADLSVRDSVKCRRLIESDWYQRRWRQRYQLCGDQNQKHRFDNDQTGYRIATSVGGAATGERGDVIVVDDPHSVKQAESDLQRRSTVEWFSGTMCTRLNDFTTGRKVVIQQRLHESDVTGDLLAKGGYEHLCLPAEFEPERRCVTSIWTDPRTEAGQLLWPEKVTAEHLAQKKRELGSYRYAGQYQQRPAPADGGTFKRAWFRFWRPADMDLPPVEVRQADGSYLQIAAIPLPEEFDTMIQSWDMAFKVMTTVILWSDTSGGPRVPTASWSISCAPDWICPGPRRRCALSARYPKATAKLGRR